MDALELLGSQHVRVANELEEAVRAGLSAERSRGLAHQLLGHMVIEEHLFYPRLGAAVDDDNLVARCFEEHMITRFALGRAMVADGDARARFGALRDVCLLHFEEEERSLFPRARLVLSPTELVSLGADMAGELDRLLVTDLSDILETDGSLRLREPPRDRPGPAKARLRRPVTR